MPLTLQQRQKLAEEIRKAHDVARYHASMSALGYLQHVVIDSRPEPAPFRDVAEPWQWTLLSRMIPALESIAGVGPKDYRGPRSFWLTLPRGHDKSSSIGRLASWVLAFSTKSVRAIAAAADREQAGFIADFMEAETRLNPWLKSLLTFSKGNVIGKKQQSQLRILAADDKSSYGLKEDLMILDELTHWSKRALWDAIFSGREKRPDSVLIIITNAGMIGSWQHEVYLEAQSRMREYGDWYVYEAPGQIASWMNQEKVQALRKMLPPGIARRLFDNVWVDPGEEAGFVTRSEASRCIDTSLTYQQKGKKEWRYVASIDYGVVKDRTVMCVGHCEGKERVVLDRMDVIQGSPERRVSIESVERWLDEVIRDFRPALVTLDPYQMESTAQRYGGIVPVERFESRGGKANYELASTLRSLVVNRQLAFYEGAGGIVVDGKLDTLVDEMAGVLIKPMSYGFRIDHERGRHDDRVIALGQMCLHALRLEEQIVIPTGDRWF